MAFKEEFLKELIEIFRQKEFQGVQPEAKAQIDGLVAYLLRPTVTPKALGLTYATIKYWESKGYLILSVSKETDEWRKYTVIESLWFEVLKQLVEMGCNLEKTVPKILYAYTNYKGVNMGFTIGEEQIPSLVIEGIRVNALNNFLYHVIRTIISKSKSAIYLSEQGGYFFFQRGIDKTELANQMYLTTFSNGINICLSEILFTHVLGVETGIEKLVDIFTEKEKSIIELLHKKEISRIIIKQENGNIYELNYEEKIDVKNLNKELGQFITEGYQELSFKTNNNKKAVLVRTTKRKL